MTGPLSTSSYRRVEVRHTGEWTSFLVVHDVDDQLADELRVRAASSRLLSVQFRDPGEVTVFFGPSVASVSVEVVPPPDTTEARQRVGAHEVSFYWEAISS